MVEWTFEFKELQNECLNLMKITILLITISIWLFWEINEVFLKDVAFLKKYFTVYLHPRLSQPVISDLYEVSSFVHDIMTSNCSCCCSCSGWIYTNISTILPPTNKIFAVFTTCPISIVDNDCWKMLVNDNQIEFSCRQTVPRIHSWIIFAIWRK